MNWEILIIFVGLLTINWVMIGVLMSALHFFFGFYHGHEDPDDFWPPNTAEWYGNRFRKLISSK